VQKTLTNSSMSNPQLFTLTMRNLPKDSLEWKRKRNGFDPTSHLLSVQKRTCNLGDCCLLSAAKNAQNVDIGHVRASFVFGRLFRDGVMEPMKEGGMDISV
jgi:hypothetical protein